MSCVGEPVRQCQRQLQWERARVSAQHEPSQCTEASRISESVHGGKGACISFLVRVVVNYPELHVSLTGNET